MIPLSIVVPFCLRYDYNGNNVQLLQKDRRLLFFLFARVDHDDDDDDRSSGVSDSSKITYNPSHQSLLFRGRLGREGVIMTSNEVTVTHSHTLTGKAYTRRRLSRAVASGQWAHCGAFFSIEL